MKFEQEYKKLNKAQREAVEAVEGPVMVVAGPGTGKTQILTLRIANILRKTDMPPEAILALTFTESGVASMRKRLVEIIGTPAYSVTINTFHGFCNEIIKNNPEEFPKIIGSQNITEVDQIDIIEDAIRNLNLKYLKPFGDQFFYARETLKAINDLKREGVDPDKFKKIIAREEKIFWMTDDLYHEKGAYKGKMKGEYQKLEKKINKNKELGLLYEYYQEALSKNKLYDYSDMIMEVLRELKTNKNLLLVLQEQYQYILVDEHQDTNNAQNQVLELLCNFHKNPNIFVVGDEKQAIFRFQGASLQNFEYFRKLYPKAKEIILEDNYRSTQSILDSVHGFFKDKKRLMARAGHREEKIQILSFSKSLAESFYVALDIKKLIAKKVRPNEIAVLYRDNRDVFGLAEAFEKVGLPFVIESDQDILADEDIKKLLAIMTWVSDFGSEEKLVQCLHIDFLGITPLDVYKILGYTSKKDITIQDLIKHKKNLEKIDLESAERIHDFYKKAAGWVTIQKNQGLAEFFELMIRESGFLASIIKKPDMVDKIDKLNELFDEIKNLLEKHKNYELKDFMRYLDVLRTHNLLIKKSYHGSSVKNVRLMTAHRSKGQEFDYVYIVNAFDGHWGNKRRADLLALPDAVYSVDFKSIIKNGDENADERRLFYVALTRARKVVKISYAREGVSGNEQIPSQFIQEIRPELIDEIATQKVEEGINSQTDLIYGRRIKSGASVKDKEFIKELFTKNGLSVTALNNYLNCPWKYFYTNLLRMPKAKDRHQVYGTAIHGALKDFFDCLGSNKANLKLLLTRFKFHLAKGAIKQKDFEELLAKGEKSLTGYYNNYQSAWRGNLVNEFRINGIVLEPDIRITGQIDKMEILNNKNEVNVVDYKTGKQKTRGEIEGKTQTSQGDIKRQLVFYKLLLDKFGKYKMISGDIDFIEPDEKGRYRKESFYINPKEVIELEKLVIKTAREILNLDFWDKGCGEKDCEFCQLRKMM